MVDCEALKALRKERDELRDDRDRWRICSSEWVAKATKLEAERDAAKRETDGVRALSRGIAKTHNEWKTQRDSAQTQIRKLEIERDGWEAKAKKLQKREDEHDHHTYEVHIETLTNALRALYDSQYGSEDDIDAATEVARRLIEPRAPEDKGRDPICHLQNMAHALKAEELLHTTAKGADDGLS